MSLINYFSFAVSPLLIFAFVLYLKFKFSIKSFVNIRNAVLLGAISIVLLIIANYLIELKWDGNYKNMRRMAFFVFVVVAFSSEFAKFIPLKFSFYKLKNFSGPLEGVIYSAFISLGFSMVATVLYAFGLVGSLDKFHNFTLFLYTLPLANLVFGIAMGFFVGMAKLRKNTFIDCATGIFVATFFHGLFYFGFVTSDIRLLIFDAIGFTIIGITFLVKSVSLKLEDKR
ncbi:MAG: PrsW family intramembrane metalloprotease [Bacteroidetes bacterium]|nr:PrsW family intramembrane metalloprotease [Bacteroidota bacterium]MBL6943589.1 PrsW family intramembrane metalloprotease [Bacteroidales bacterium]